ncbi:hypothetical protein C5F48_11865 [Cereibacter changlensis JA139]|uniref:DUF4238 domain-containing protein n=2 Tax=Cereibacter changlensis TaxID=402884 RepID=A0A2T4JUC6_9RHOB|nr:DUF4238 domain-containing protein [Cereibacter changlensis]PTE21512.1 hypothetical protein C5F48_11865 [Cereibacter changlensis JA139]PZX54495.1 uncharacterized protein DUF4238 [Cereibacter changlensis]
MSTGYRHNHYVPEWYQKQFLPAGTTRHHYLDLKPDRRTSNGHSFLRKNLHFWGPKQCFAQDDLYTTRWGHVENRDIEKFFFGHFDTTGPKAVKHFANFQFNSDAGEALTTLLPYMSVQKLRTPKGLAWLRKTFKTRDRNSTLTQLQRLQNLFCAIWGEAVWQIADATHSATKFIISDHPVVTYNRECFPGSRWCIGENDPDIRFAATHTYFPLSSDKVLILTNLNWARDPYQNPMTLRPNPRFMRSAALFKITDIQHERHLTEEEVIEINYITKMRALRYVAAAKREWLFPEKYLRSKNWRKLGDGYLLMPDPRHIHGGGKMFVGYKGGRSESWSEYGHRPWEGGYEDGARQEREWAAMQKFKTEWAATYGPDYRGVLYDVVSHRDGVRRSMGEEWHREECERDAHYIKLPGEQARRRKLRR